MSMQPVNDLLTGALTDVTAAAAALDPAAVWIGVATAISPAGQRTVMGNITEATGAMATRVKITAWSSQHQLLDGTWLVDGPLARFAPASSAEAQTLVAWFLADAVSAGNLLAYGLINPPVVLADNTQEWVIVLRVGLPNTAIISAETTFNG